jgi:cell division protein FtsW
MVYSASLPEGLKKFDDPFHFVGLQLFWVGLGVVAFQWMIRTPLSFWWHKSPFLLIFGAVLATYFVSKELNGAARWVSIGPFNLQPSELAKPLLILQAVWVIDHWRSLKPWVRYGWVITLLLLIFAVYKQPSLSMAILMAIVLWLVTFAGGGSLRWLVGVALLGGGGLVYRVMDTTYQVKRVNSFMDPFASAQDGGYQVVQSLLAIGSGGLWGVGYGLSAQKVDFLTYSYSDFIFAIFAEEFGFIGVIAFLVFLTLFALLGLRVSLRFSAPRGVRLLALGCTLMLTIQSLLHLAVVTGSLPPTGMPLPFVSYGGSGILGALFTAGLLVRAAREAGPMRLDTTVIASRAPRRRRTPV